MDALIKATIWNQFGAAIDMLDDAITACPDELWTAKLWDDEEDARFGQIWFIAYHATMYVDVYTSGASRKAFTPPDPFLNGKLPDAPYPKDVVQAYLKRGREKCKTIVLSLTDEQAAQVLTFDWGNDITFVELLLYNMRHVQEHAAQINYLLGRHGLNVGDWVGTARESEPAS